MEQVYLVVLSGGQDSTTCLWWAKRRWPDEKINTLTFDYGQRHSKELEAARIIATRAGVSHAYMTAAKLRGTSPLVSDTELGKYEKIEDLPGGIEPTFIPGRNIMFLTLAANYAMSLRQTPAPAALHLVMGVCEADYGGYPDCRQSFLDMMQAALNEGIFGDPELGAVQLYAPLMHLTKKQSVELAASLGCLDELGYTHTCYEGGEKPCGQCHACMIRARGFLEAKYPDPLYVRNGLDWPPPWAMRQTDEPLWYSGTPR